MILYRSFLPTLLAGSLLFAAFGCRTAQPPSAGEPLDVIAFGSCAGQDQPQPIWEAIAAQEPDLFLFIGDNIYADTEDMQVMRRKYDQLGAQPGYRKLLQTTPVLAVWDDHDYGVNDGGAEYPMRAASQQEFLRFFDVPASSPRRQRPGLYDAYTFGPESRRVQVILLDTRYFRSPLQKDPGGRAYVPNPDPDVTMLGEAQWQWLEAQLQQPADVRIIASSIQVVPEEHAWEKWANLPRERDRLFRLIEATGAGGILFISGDRHLAELSRLDPAGTGPDYPLYDLTSSSLNRPSRRRPGDAEPNRHRTGDQYLGVNFGLITIDWSREDPLLSLQIRDGAGGLVFKQDVPLSTIQPK